MKNTTRTALGLTAAFLVGYATALWHAPAPHAQGAKPAYVVTSSVALEPDKLGPYREASQPLAQRAGAEVLGGTAAGGTFQVLEGEWPYEGDVGLQRFDSMDALLRLSNSPEYREAKKLREGFIKPNFIIAFEGTD